MRPTLVYTFWGHEDEEGGFPGSAVAALKSYLACTAAKYTGKLFLSPTNHDRPLTVQQLDSHISALKRLAEPDSKAKVHEVHKYAASYSFAETMIVWDLVSALEWSELAVFYNQ